MLREQENIFKQQFITWKGTNVFLFIIWMGQEIIRRPPDIILKEHVFPKSIYYPEISRKYLKASWHYLEGTMHYPLETRLYHIQALI